MKNKFAFFLLLSIYFLLTSCDGKKDEKAEKPSQELPSTENIVVDYGTLQGSIKKILAGDNVNTPIMEDLKKIDILLGQMNEMKGINPIIPDAILSGPIKFDSAVIRKDSFDVQFSHLRPIFPEYFEIEKKHIDELIDKLKNESTFDVIRIYPIYDSRSKGRVMYSYAIMGGKKGSNSFSNYIVDILDPCPPPSSGCQKLKDAIQGNEGVMVKPAK